MVAVIPLCFLCCLSSVPAWRVESGWFLLIESSRRISRISAHIKSTSTWSAFTVLLIFHLCLPGALCAVTCAVIPHRWSLTCGSTPETRTTTTSKLTKPLMRQSLKAAGENMNSDTVVSVFKLLKDFYVCICKCQQNILWWCRCWIFLIKLHHAVFEHK